MIFFFITNILAKLTDVSSVVFTIKIFAFPFFLLLSFLKAAFSEKSFLALKMFVCVLIRHLRTRKSSNLLTHHLILVFTCFSFQFRDSSREKKLLQVLESLRVFIPSSLFFTKKIDSDQNLILHSSLIIGLLHIIAFLECSPF